MEIRRALTLPAAGTETFFLWGPRQTGKSTLLRSTYPGARWIDLLKAEQFRRYATRPELLREEVALAGSPPFVVIDEIQKVPALLDEVHWLHENRGARFALCGSSARSLRRGRANLLGGRGLRFELHGLSAFEIGEGFDLVRLLNHGALPPIYLGEQPRSLLDTYVSHYLKEEIAAEGLVRRLPAFADFLALAALANTEPVNHTTIARDVGMSSTTVRAYYDILVDTLLGRWLPAYRRRPKRRLVRAPKFYLFDTGVAGFLARWGAIEAGSELFGKAFESWVFHELCAYNACRRRFAELFYWRLSTGVEVDFIVNHLDAAVEAKATPRVHRDHLKGLRELERDHPGVGRRLVVSLDPVPRRTEDGIDILPAARFVEELWAGAVF